jgi:hypothetical protein
MLRFAERKNLVGAMLALAVFGAWQLTVGSAAEQPLDFNNRIHVQFSEQQRFGIVCTKVRESNDPERPLRLTRDERGITNNTMVRIDGYEYIYGVEIPGVRYVRDQGKLVKEVPIPGKDKDRAWQTAWETEFGRIRVTQSVEIVLGEQTRLYDTALVKYQIWNRDKEAHTVGLRLMLDTCLGANQGPSFQVPASGGKAARLVDKMEVIDAKEVPDFVMAVGDDPKDAKVTTATVGLKLKDFEPLDKVVMCRWPQNSEARWGGGKNVGDFAYEAIDKNPKAKDSCILLYWSTSKMEPDAKRELAFSYGLGRITKDPSAK